MLVVEDCSYDAQRRAHLSNVFRYCTISFVPCGRGRSQAQKGQYSACGEADLRKLHLIGHQPITVGFAAGRLCPTGHMGTRA